MTRSILSNISLQAISTIFLEETPMTQISKTMSLTKRKKKMRRGASETTRTILTMRHLSLEVLQFKGHSNKKNIYILITGVL
jgi:hypothetical protein